MSKRVAIAALALLYALAMLPGATGIPLHEWLGLAAGIAIAAHCARHVATAVALARKVSARNVGILACDAALALAAVIAVVSGLMISGTVLPTFGLFASGFFFWDPVHALSAKASAALLLVHITLHRRWFMKAIRHLRG